MIAIELLNMICLGLCCTFRGLADQVCPYGHNGFRLSDKLLTQMPHS